MDLPEFCIAPHEIGGWASDEPLCAPAMTRVWVGNRWRKRAYLLRAMQMSGWDAGRMMAVARCEERRDAPLLHIPYSPFAQEFDWTGAKSAYHLTRCKLDRILNFDANGRLSLATADWHRRLVLRRYEIPFWFINHQHGENCRFQFPPVHWIFDLIFKRYQRWFMWASDAQIEGEVGALLADPHSDCAFSWRWVGLSEQEKHQLQFCVKQGTLRQCEEILRAALWIDSTWSASEDWRWEWLLDMAGENPDPLTSSVIVEKSELDNGGQRVELPPRLRRLLCLVCDYFVPRRNPATAMTSAVRFPLQYRRYFWRVPVDAPSQHQRLEAQLLLRDWLQGKVSSTELAELMEQ